MSTRLDQLRNAIELACLTEDRSDAEQRSLLALAVHVDSTANRLVTTNKRQGHAWTLHRAVEQTRVLSDGQKLIEVDAKTRLRLSAQAVTWDRFADAYRRGEWTPEMAAEARGSA